MLRWFITIYGHIENMKEFYPSLNEIALEIKDRAKHPCIDFFDKEYGLRGTIDFDPHYEEFYCTTEPFIKPIFKDIYTLLQEVNTWYNEELSDHKS